MIADRGEEPNARCKLSISLTRDMETGAWFADRIELDLGDARNVTSFSRPTPIASVFSAEFIEELTPFLPDSAEATMLVDSNAVLETPRLVLGSIRVAAHQPMHGIQHVVIRFRKALGLAQSVLRPKHRLESATLTALEQSAGEALLNLLRPCIDLATVDGIDPSDERIGRQVAERLEMLSENKEELAFFSYLLKRYIENLPDADARAPALEHMRRHNLAAAMAR
ncbi:hypothetical protein P1J78_14100 [Psychromarinibacter sp. C21-152]|uniref:Uncharacterized protein n=1 Tax=Psychromarinibacter sediminicola TaxID=3033385 RepID=A0AAE3NUF8_9RHOB|nr:hypothetical protein [Psychromarinibacter sediminicola]MDF0601874.1 hypothetical protein [Psychromarinibacter sediminicola]